MSNSRKLTSKIIFVLSAAFCIAAAGAILYSRFSDSRTEALISNSTEAPPMRETQEPAPAAPRKAEPAPLPAPVPNQPPQAEEQMPPLSPEALAVRDAAAAFFKDYISLLSSPPQQGQNSLSRVVDFLYQRPEAHLNLAEKVDRQITKFLQEKEGEALPIDPILLSQGTPLAMKYDEPALSDNQAALIAYTVWEGGAERPLCLSLIKAGEIWQIEDVGDMSLPGGKNECGGKKARPGGSAPLAEDAPKTDAPERKEPAEASKDASAPPAPPAPEEAAPRPADKPEETAPAPEAQAPAVLPTQKGSPSAPLPQNDRQPAAPELTPWPSAPDATHEPAMPAAPPQPAPPSPAPKPEPHVQQPTQPPAMTPARPPQGLAPARPPSSRAP